MIQFMVSNFAYAILLLGMILIVIYVLITSLFNK